MALLSVSNVKIEGVSACVPERVVENSTSTLLPPDELEKYKVYGANIALCLMVLSVPLIYVMRPLKG